MNPEFGNLEQPRLCKGMFWCDEHQTHHSEPKCPSLSDYADAMWRAPRPATTAEVRKQQPLATGCLDYFPDALLAVANCSYVGNAQHNGEGTPLRWDRSKSTDEADALLRHLKDRGTLDTDGVRHSAKVAWRSLSLLQREIEAERAK